MSTLTSITESKWHGILAQHLWKQKRGKFMQEKNLWITKTALLLAMLIVLQAVTRSFSQLVTGSCVNAVLALAILVIGFSSGIIVAAISPFAAFLLGIGPQLFPIVPAIAVGNIVFVAVLWVLTHKHQDELKWSLIGWFFSALCKFLTLYVIVVQLLCHILPLKEAQIAAFSAMFSWPQLFTALIGGAAAMLIAPRLRRALRSES